MAALIEEAKQITVRRSEIWLADFGDKGGHLQRGIRVCVIISNDINNRYSPIVQAIPISSATNKKPIPTHVKLEAAESGLERDSIVLCEQSTPINKTDLKNPITKLSPKIMTEIEKAILLHNGIGF